MAIAIEAWMETVAEQNQPQTPDLVDYSKIPFFIEPLEKQEYTIYVSEQIGSCSFEYSYDTQIWQPTILPLTISDGSRVYMRGQHRGLGLLSLGVNVKFSIGGNLYSLSHYDLFGEVDTMIDGYASLVFWSSYNLVDASRLALPATTLAFECYSSMFADCTSLTKAPELPATTLAGACYGGMFADCTSLTKAPELPATTLAGACYSDMFEYCTSLTKAPELPATTLTDECYKYMFVGCTSLKEIRVHALSHMNDSFMDWLEEASPSGTIYKYDSLELPSGNSGIPSGWTTVSLDS